MAYEPRTLGSRSEQKGAFACGPGWGLRTTYIYGTPQDLPFPRFDWYLQCLMFLNAVLFILFRDSTILRFLEPSLTTNQRGSRNFS